MHVLVNHSISNPEGFWSFVKANPAMPEGFTVQSLMAGTDPSKAACLWNAPNVDSLKAMMDGMLKGLCTNTYMQINEGNSFGLPDVMSASKDMAASHI
jgi:hypothetical protein